MNAAGQITQTYVYASRPNVPDLIVQADGDVYRVVHDHLGSVRLVVNVATGVVAHRMRFDEWGVLVEESGDTSLHPFGYAGGLYDRTTGLTRFGARDYEPGTGRWTAKDPVRFEGRQANLYAYVGDNPVIGFDPTGLASLREWATVVFRSVNFWTGPTNVLGILYGAVDGEFERIDDGRITFSGTNRDYDRTIGDVICYSDSMPIHPNREHEMAHTQQHTILGRAYVPAHLISQSASFLITGSYDESNPLEWGPNQNPPTPWSLP